MRIVKKILLRRGTCEQGNKLNFVLADGEPAYEEDTRKLKFGDGKTQYRDLPYFNESDDIKIDDIAHMKILMWLCRNYGIDFLNEQEV